MRKIIGGFIVSLLVVALLAGGAAIWYVRPAEKLTLDHSPLDFRSKAAEMIQSGKAEVFLSQEDITNLVRAQLAENPQVRPELRIEGVRIQLDGERMAADISAKYKSLLTVGAKASYKLEWRSPDLILTPQSLSIRSLELPETMLDEIVIPVGSQLPPLVGIRSVTFRDHGAAVGLKLQL
ncbi:MULTISPECIES: hypothetical protein [unclassified Paenibacillus]|uniref:hypothetical protein n=1 Tax=unclassified Paenibacillus TaxID=185978 RepID=UPI000953F878|nr:MULTISPECIES: hypothetical protein [unclassified Paenibacillus]ASS67160.1 hypothetical protein CIC07_14190 [Paenibacillus sp. RUD330]SIQ87777.1 hypothetical protein SAMN05880555_2589 [Paenibacillus sp. RU4X]SIR08902.1 hypothetical protein SAMN05880570_2589 [Paenibacillus sp. RU4T]